MARVKMLTRLSGTRDGVAWPDLGEELGVPGDEAATLEALGHAELVTGASPAKRARKAVVEAPEER